MEQPQYRVYLELLKHPEPVERKAATYALRAYSCDDSPERRKEIVVGLVNALKHSAAEAAIALTTLRLFGGDARAAVPIIFTVLNKSVGYWEPAKCAALKALLFIWTDPKVAQPPTDKEIALVAQHLASDEPTIAAGAVEIMGAVGPRAEGYLSSIVQAALNHWTDYGLLESVEYALREIGRPTSPPPSLINQVLTLGCWHGEILPMTLRETLGNLAKQLLTEQ